MKRLIINADDFGLSPAVNEGIIRAFEAGGITNTTLMVRREAAREAVRYAKANPALCVGLHLDLDHLLGRGEQGEERFGMAKLGPMLEDPSFLCKVETEIDGQIDAFRETGLELTHLDGHHHLHALPQLFPIIVEKMAVADIRTVRFCRSFDLIKYPPIVWTEEFFREMGDLLDRYGIRHADHFITGWKPHDLRSLKEGTTELMTHPGTEEAWRKEELDELLGGEWREMVETEGVGLISFRDLACLEGVT